METGKDGAVKQTLLRVTLGGRQGSDRLAMYPLLDAAAPVKAAYILARDAFASGSLEVTEITESGQVPTLRVRNRGSSPVLLLDGEELIGAKQNRVLNLTILIAAGAVLDVPVSCVERGRWSYRSRHFKDSDYLMHADGRAAKFREVNEGMRSRGVREADQHGVWSRLDAKAASMRTSSPTSAMHDTFMAHQEAIEAAVVSLNPVPHQVGAVFEVNGRAGGIELFDAIETFTRMFPKIVRSYALDALDPGRDRTGTGKADAFLAAVAVANQELYPALGLGEDVRLSNQDVQGGALAVAGRVVHLSALASR